MDDWRKQRDLLIEETMVFAQRVRINAPKQFEFPNRRWATRIVRRCNTARTSATANVNRSPDIKRGTRLGSEAFGQLQSSSEEIPARARGILHANHVRRHGQHDTQWIPGSRINGA